MDVQFLKGKLPSEILESLDTRHIKTLTPPQELAIEKGLISGKNLLVASPTASGKTLIAELACINAIISKGMKAVYIAPMRALVSEKFNEFRSAYPYIKTAISMGDLDSSDQWLADYEMIFVSTEKFDSLMRHGINWIGEVGCIVFDEIHLLADLERGPTLELLMTKLSNTSDAQILALSATIGNANELADWLKAELVESTYRPVKLLKGIVKSGQIFLEESKKSAIDLDGKSSIPEIRVLEDTLSRKKQLLIFYSTKRNAEAGAVRLSEIVETILTVKEKEELSKISNNVLNTLERPTQQCSKLAGLIMKGVAFHHSGLLNSQREQIENSFKAGLLKAICSTTTLGFGVNMPAHTVLIRDITRHDGYGSQRLSVNEVLQLCGRAGRPKYDTEGRALLIATTTHTVNDLYKHYISAGPEPLDSAISVAPVLRTHILAFIAENFLNTFKDIQDFLSKTFYGYQYGDAYAIKRIVSDVLNDLKSWEFVQEVSKESYIATKLGKRISELYIDPLSARWIIDYLPYANDTTSTLYMLSNTIEMRPYVRTTEDAEAQFVIYNNSHGKRLFHDDEYGQFDPLGAFTTSLMLNDWTSEVDENTLVEKYHITPGALYTKLRNVDWIAYSAIELSRILHRSAHNLINARVRLRYGIKEELLDLVRLEFIGRVRARRLYNSNIKSVSDIRKNPERLASILGKEIANKVKEQLSMIT